MPVVCQNDFVAAFGKVFLDERRGFAFVFDAQDRFPASGHGVPTFQQAAIVTQRYSIRTRLSLSLALLGLLALALGVFSVASLRTVDSASAQIRDRWLQSVRFLGDVTNYTSDFRGAEADRLLARTPADAAAADRAVANLDRIISVSRRNYESLPHSGTEAELWRDFEGYWATYRAVADQEFALARRRRVREAEALYRSQSMAAYRAASDAVDLLTDRTVRSANEASDRADETFHQAFVWIGIAMAVAGLWVVLSIWHIARTVSGPILGLAGRMRELAANRTEGEIEGTARGDEIGEMARAVVVFRNNAIELMASQRGLEQQASMLAEKLEAERELAAMQRNFISVASHEFRTPLTWIDGQAQRLLKMKGASGDEILERAGKIRAAVQRITNVMDRLLNSSRLVEERGSLYFHPAPIDLAAILREVCQVYREIASGAKIDEDFSGLPPQVEGDARLLDQAFGNLLSNAIKYSPGGARVRVHGGVEGGPEGAPTRVWVAVEDQGMGIPSEDREHLFERHFRGAMVKGIVGTGIGLYLAKMIVDMHGGGIRVESETGRGSRFTVILPIAQEGKTVRAMTSVESQ